MWSPDRSSHSTALWTVEKKSLCSRSRGTKAVYHHRQNPLNHPFPLKKRCLQGLFLSPASKELRVCTETSVWIISSSKLSSWSPGTTPRCSFVWGNKPFVELYSSLFSMAHLRNAARVPFFFWNCCLLIHILGVNVLPSVHITHLGG